MRAEATTASSLYATPQTVATLERRAGLHALALRLRDTRRPAAERTVAAVRDELRAITGVHRLRRHARCITSRASYPGKEYFEQHRRR